MPPLSLISLFKIGYFEYKHTVQPRYPQKEEERRKKSRKTSAYQDNFRWSSSHLHFSFWPMKEVFGEKGLLFQVWQGKLVKNCYIAFDSFSKVHSSTLFHLIFRRLFGILIMPRLPMRKWNLRMKGLPRPQPSTAWPRASNSPEEHRIHSITLTWACLVHLQRAAYQVWSCTTR